MEEDSKVQVCRLCFGLIPDNNFARVDGSLKEMLDAITSDLNLDITYSPVMCSECSKSLQEIFNFKTNFFESEEKIESKLVERRDVKQDLWEIMNSSLKFRPKRSSTRLKLKQQRFCRTCLKIIEDESFRFINKDTDVDLCSLLENHLSELDINLTLEPVMCQNCIQMLHKMDIFLSNCNENESKINTFIEKVGSEFKQVNIHSVLQFSISPSYYSDVVPEYVTVITDHSSGNCIVKGEKLTIIKKEIMQKRKDEPILTEDNPSDPVEMEEIESKLIEEVCEQDSPSNKRSRPTRSCTQMQKRTGKRTEETDSTHSRRCSDCKFKTKYKNSLKRHVFLAHKREVETKRKYYECSECNFKFKWNIDLTRHMLSHVKPEAVSCTKCSYSTDNNSLLVKHILSHVDPEDMVRYSFLQLNKKEKH